MNKTPVTVKDLIGFLKGAPQDAVVQVLAEKSKHWETTTDWINLSLPEKSDGLTDSFYIFNNTVQLGQE